MEEIEYQEVFKKNVLKKDVKYVINAIKEVHSKEFGWIIEEPNIIPIDENYVQIQVLLKKIKNKSRSF